MSAVGYAGEHTCAAHCRLGCRHCQVRRGLQMRADLIGEGTLSRRRSCRWVRSFNFYTSWPPRASIFLWPAFVTRLLTPRSRKSGYGLLLGCRSPLIDAGHEKNFFYALFLLKTVKTSSGGRARHCNRSSVVELVGREPLIIARVENGVTKFSPRRQKTPKLSIYIYVAYKSIDSLDPLLQLHKPN